MKNMKGSVSIFFDHMSYNSISEVHCLFILYIYFFSSILPWVKSLADSLNRLPNFDPSRWHYENEVAGHLFLKRQKESEEAASHGDCAGDASINWISYIWVVVRFLVGVERCCEMKADKEQW